MDNNCSKKFWSGKAAHIMIPGLLAALAVAAIAPRSAIGNDRHEDSLVRFDQGIGVDPISNVVVNGTTTTVIAKRGAWYFSRRPDLARSRISMRMWPLTGASAFAGADCCWVAETPSERTVGKAFSRRCFAGLPQPQPLPVPTKSA